MLGGLRLYYYRSARATRASQYFFESYRAGAPAIPWHSVFLEDFQRGHITKTAALNQR